MMFHIKRLSSFLCLFLLLCNPVFSTPNPSSIKRLHSLRGDWALVDTKGNLSDLRASYQITANGAAVMETMFLGTPQETVTLYHLEGKKVSATQVNGQGVLHRFTRVETKDKNQLRFETKTSPVKRVDLFMLGQSHLRIQWFMAAEAGGVESSSFELKREVSVQDLAAETARLRVKVETIQQELDRRMKQEITVKRKGKPLMSFLETRTQPPGPGWNVSGTPFRIHLHNKTTKFASTFASEGDKGMTVAHYGFKAGPECRLRFSVLGGHGAIAIVLDDKTPPRQIRNIPDFATKLNNGDYGTTIDRIVGGRWSTHPVSVDWDLARFEGKSLRLYVVDDKTNHYGQIAISEVSILEKAPQ